MLQNLNEMILISTHLKLVNLPLTFIKLFLLILSHSFISHSAFSSHALPFVFCPVGLNKSFCLHFACFLHTHLLNQILVSISFRYLIFHYFFPSYSSPNPPFLDSFFLFLFCAFIYPFIISFSFPCEN